MVAGELAEAEGGQEAVAAEIAGGAVAGDAGCAAAAGVEVRNGDAVRPKDPGARVDAEAALGVEDLI